jgi:hypothetical protein
MAGRMPAISPYSAMRIDDDLLQRGDGFAGNVEGERDNMSWRVPRL